MAGHRPVANTGLGVDVLHVALDRPDRVDAIMEFLTPVIEDLLARLDGDEFTTVDFIEVMRSMKPYYLLRLVGGALFLTGAVLMAVNLRRTFAPAGVTAVARPPLLTEAEQGA